MTITDSSFNEILRIGALVPGNEHNISPFQCELCGILGILDELLRCCPNKPGKITIYCNNKTTDNAVNKWTTEKVTSSLKNTDLVSSVLHIRDKLAIKVRGEHIYGHQDTKMAKEQLNSEAQKNIEMDAAAKQLVNTVINSNVTAPLYYNHLCSMPICKWRQEIVSQDYREMLYLHIYKQKMQQYWIGSKSMTENKCNILDYDGRGRGMKAMSVTLQQFVSKWMSKCIGTGKNLQQWKIKKKDTAHTVLLQRRILGFFCYVNMTSQKIVLEREYKEVFAVFD